MSGVLGQGAVMPYTAAKVRHTFLGEKRFILFLAVNLMHI